MVESETTVVFEFEGKHEEKKFETNLLRLCFKTLDDVLTDCPSDTITLTVMSLDTFQCIFDAYTTSLHKENFFPLFPFQQGNKEARDFLVGDDVFNICSDVVVDGHMLEMVCCGDINHEHSLEISLIGEQKLSLLKAYYQHSNKTQVNIEMLIKCYLARWQDGIDYIEGNFDIVCNCGKVLEKNGARRNITVIVNNFEQCFCQLCSCGRHGANGLTPSHHKFLARENAHNLRTLTEKDLTDVFCL